MMTEATLLDVRSAEDRALTYGRLAQSFVYPERDKEHLLEAVDYTEAFDPAASPMACSLREYHYAKEIHSTSLNEELLRFYHFFGLTRSQQALMPDHVAVELEFMQFLSALEGSALQRGEDVTSLLKAQRDFLQRHLRALLDGIQSELKSVAPSCTALVEMAAEVVEYDLARLNREVGLAGGVAA